MDYKLLKHIDCTKYSINEYNINNYWTKLSSDIKYSYFTNYNEIIVKKDNQYYKLNDTGLNIRNILWIYIFNDLLYIIGFDWINGIKIYKNGVLISRININILSISTNINPIAVKDHVYFFKYEIGLFDEYNFAVNIININTGMFVKRIIIHPYIKIIDGSFYCKIRRNTKHTENGFYIEYDVNCMLSFDRCELISIK